ncbi:MULTISPECIES: DNA (cytosine-5-)-methyltransferase [Actinomycetes]|uniref:Cytosine-specific methyltransferase n=2 Tax=Actinomycetes TaxID=1760 RepID=A0ABP6M046_9MICC
MGEFFSGPGGMALGARQAAEHVSRSLGTSISLTHQWANDFHPDTEKTYRANIRPKEFISGDVRSIDPKSLVRVDGFAFGFPCNDFSTIGEHRGLDGKFGPLYKQGVQVLETHQPKWFVAENVTGLASSNGGRALQQILEAMASAGEHGYTLVPHVYRFEEYGVPQKRRRIIIVGIRGDLKEEFRVPAPTTRDFPISVAEAFSDIPADAPNNELPRHNQTVVERLKLIAPGENAFNAKLLQGDEGLRLNVKGATLSNIYRRLEADKPSYTVTGSGGGGTHIYHWEEPRALTNRERARLQTFPNDFRFRGGPASVRKQIGMAVPVKGAKAIFEALFKTFLHVPYDDVDANMATVPANSHADEPVLA